MPRLTGSNFFGSGEYYLGMVSGLIRYAMHDCLSRWRC